MVIMIINLSLNSRTGVAEILPIGIFIIGTSLCLYFISGCHVLSVNSYPVTILYYILITQNIVLHYMSFNVTCLLH